MHRHRLRSTWAVLACLLGIAGCRETPPQFGNNEAFTELLAEAESDEDRELWLNLRKDIDNVLREKFGTPVLPRAPEVANVDPARLKLGAQIYAYRCQACHGTSGDGAGPVALYLQPRPRDYRKGVFKFTSTPYGSKPRRADLVRTIRRGVTGTSMPSFSELSDNEVEAVIDYVLLLTHRGELASELELLAEEEEELDLEYVEEIVTMIYQRWADAQQQVVTPETPMPEMTPETVAAGHELFLQRGCNKCHGRDGRGGSMGDVDVGVDVWGQKAAAADLTSGMFRGGGRPIDIYRRIHSGINGTPMPSFANLFQDDPDAIWRLVHFIRDVGERRRRNLPPLSEAEIPQVTPPSSDEQPGPVEEPEAAAANVGTKLNQLSQTLPKSNRGGPL